MAVIGVREQFKGRDGSIADSSADTRVFRVQTNVATDGPQDIFASGMIPRRGDLHNKNPNLSCKKVQCKNEDHGAFYHIVTCDYDNLPFGQLPQLAQQVNPHPLLRPVQIEGKTVIGKRARSYGYIVTTATNATWNGGSGFSAPLTVSPLETTAHEPFVGLEEDDIQYIIQVTINAPAIQFWVTAFQGCLNIGAVTVRGYPSPFPRWSLRLMNFQHSDRLTETLPSGLQVPYYQTRFELHYKRDLWVTPLLNAGYDQLVGGERKRMLTTAGDYPVKPMQVAADGTQQASPTAANALYRWVLDALEADFSVFNLSV